MKRILLGLIAFLVAFSLSPVAAQQGKTYYVNVKAAKIRVEASSTAKLVTTLGRGKPVVVLEVVTGEKVSGVDKWYKVDANGKEGYVLSSLLTDRAPVIASSSHNGSSSNSTVVTATPTPAPSTTVSAGNGATALCKDGTYSYSKHHQGTCSHHGGVAVWYK